MAKGRLCSLGAGEERDGGGGDRPRLAAPLHHRQEGAEHRADHAAAAAGEHTLPLYVTRGGGGGNRQSCVCVGSHRIYGRRGADLSGGADGGGGAGSGPDPRDHQGPGESWNRGERRPG